MGIPDISIPSCPRCGDPVTSGCYPADGICAVVDDEQPAAWSVPKIAHNEDEPVTPNIIGRWIYRSAGQSGIEHTRKYAAQLLAAADELERRQAVTDRQHAGLGLPCARCDGPCRIDDQPAED